MADAVRHHGGDNIAVVNLLTKNTELLNESEALLEHAHVLLQNAASRQPDLQRSQRLLQS